MSGVRVLVGTRKGAFVLTSDGKRETVGRQRAALRRLGDLPPQGIAGRSEPPLRLAVERLVRPDDPALERRRQDLGAGRQQVRLRRRARHAPVVRRHAASLGVQAGLASRAVADRSRHGLCRRRGRRAVPLDRRRADLARAAGAARPRLRPELGSRAPAACACTPSCSIPTNPQRMFIAISAAGAFRTDDGGETWRPINRGLQVAVHSRIPTAEVGHCVHRIAMHPSRPRRAVHAEALGRHAQRQRRRLVAGGQRQPADRLRLRDRRPRARAGDDLRRADQERLGALSRRTASCACIAAGPAATNGRR